MTLPVSSQCQPCSFGLQLLQVHVYSSNLVLTLGLVLAGRGWQDPAPRPVSPGEPAVPGEGAAALWSRPPT